MRLTLKGSKNFQGGSNAHKDDSLSLVEKISQRCCGVEQGRKHIVISAATKQDKALYQLIKYDCDTLYSRICPPSPAQRQSVYECILDTITTYHEQYTICLGYFCAHANFHYSVQQEKEHAIYLFNQSYRPAISRPLIKEALLRETLNRFYAYLVDSQIDPAALKLEQIARRYQESLLLEFVPVEYSEFIIQEYLGAGDPEEYIQLATSVVHFIVSTKNPLDAAHCTQMMMNPYMGVVEWPIVIGHRKLFKPPEEEDPQV